MRTNPICVKIGLAIRHIRVKRGETELSMSVKLRYKSHSSYAKIERGECESLSILKLLTICDLLEVRVSDLLELAGVNQIGIIE